MERLTEFSNGIWSLSLKAIKAGYDKYSLASRLAAYENTGLMPEEITELNTFVGSQVEKLLAENARLKTRRMRRWVMWIATALTASSGKMKPGGVICRDA